MAVLEQMVNSVQADPYLPPSQEPLEWLCTCWGQQVPYCLQCKVCLAEAAAADTGKPPCTDEVCQGRIGCNSTTWGCGLCCQEDAKPAMAGYVFSH